MLCHMHAPHACDELVGAGSPCEICHTDLKGAHRACSSHPSRTARIVFESVVMMPVLESRVRAVLVLDPIGAWCVRCGCKRAREVVDVSTTCACGTLAAAATSK